MQEYKNAQLHEKMNAVLHEYRERICAAADLVRLSYRTLRSTLLQ